MQRGTCLPNGLAFSCCERRTDFLKNTDRARAAVNCNAVLGGCNSYDTASQSRKQRVFGTERRSGLVAQQGGYTAGACAQRCVCPLCAAPWLCCQLQSLPQRARSARRAAMDLWFGSDSLVRLRYAPAHLKCTSMASQSRERRGALPKLPSNCASIAVRMPKSFSIPPAEQCAFRTVPPMQRCTSAYPD